MNEPSQTARLAARKTRVCHVLTLGLPQGPLLPLILLLCLSVLSGCASSPQQRESLNYRERAQTKEVDGVRVTTVVLSPQETVNTFAVPLASKEIQPVWVEIENRTDKEFVLMLLSIDPNYFAPSEVAWIFRGRYGLTFDELTDLLLEKHLPIVVAPQSTASGYVYTNLDPGAKAFAIELVGEKETRLFEFVQVVPGFEADFMRVDFQNLYQEHEVKDLNLEGLRRYLEQLQCCALGGDRKTPGDPLNLVIVGEGRHMLATLVRKGWDLTETMRRDTAWRTFASSLFGSKYRTSPISPLYLFGRRQDVALQKSRHSVDERNHLRLWLAPVTLNGESVWIGQISRDIGVKLTSKTFVTHKIDPVVDEARLYITLDIAASENLRVFGYVNGVGQSDRDSPRLNYTNDPYYTDGRRVVLFLSQERQPLDKIEFLDWVDPQAPVSTGSPPSN